jgi:Na+/melibiose symporter-like transporter
MNVGYSGISEGRKKIREVLRNASGHVLASNSLSMLLLSGTMLFYHLAQQKSLMSPITYVLVVSIVLIILSSLHSIKSTVDVVEELDASRTMANITSDDKYLLYSNKIFYTVTSIIFSLTLLFISYLLIKYNKK